MIRAFAIVLALGLAFAVLEQLGAAGPLRVTVLPRKWAIFGGDICIRIHVESGDDVRMLTLVVDADNFYTSRELTLNPTDPATLEPTWIKRPPPGYYVIDVTLFERGGEKGKAWHVRAREHLEIEILGGE